MITHHFRLNHSSSLGYPCPANYNLADHLIHTLAIVPGEEDECRARVQVFIKQKIVIEMRSHD